MTSMKRKRSSPSRSSSLTLLRRIVLPNITSLTRRTSSSVQSIQSSFSSASLSKSRSPSSSRCKSTYRRHPPTRKVLHGVLYQNSDPPRYRHHRSKKKTKKPGISGGGMILCMRKFDFCVNLSNHYF